MLALSPLRSHGDEREVEMESFSIGGDDFVDFSGGNLLDSIDFDDLFVGIDDEEDVLPDLEMDSELLAEFSLSSEESEMNTSLSFEKFDNYSVKDNEEEDKNSGTENTIGSQEEEIVSKRDESAKDSTKESEKGRKSSKNSHGKRKVKVDWTPELHRRFVQAVEQLGVDKAVPSRILELMGIDSLTRHNIASHLQKYRSHRKHLLAREAEAASWSQRRQMYGGATTTGGIKREVSPWQVAAPPTMGFPPPPLHHHHHHHFRPLHVWGHPSMDQSFMHMWPKHLPPSPPPPATWAPPPPRPPPPDPSFWPPHHHQRVPNPITPRFPPPPMATTRYTSPPVPGIAMYKVDPGIGVPTAGQPGPHPPLDFHPSKESIDAALGDVLSKPWQPLPLGLKPPSLDSVLVELQLQGIPKIPPT